ncbi:hypothetical protein [Actinoplanes subtropicus]|uniref:hypothetical protein n=1 Tax=Actinoplanes subtropicus TaxID=543632 RepID=UPI0009FE68F5|nr:hypothetical protein [Actinoplanes subtropicus]
MLLRLDYLGVTDALALLRLLPMSDRDKDAEILALRHQITVLERQRASPDPTAEPAALTRLRIRRHDRLGGLLHEYDRALEQHGWHYQHPHDRGFSSRHDILIGDLGG